MEARFVGSPERRKQQRRERVEQALALRGQDRDIREIAETLGVAYSTARNYLSDPNGKKLAARKAKRRGRCEVCGAEISPGKMRCRKHQLRQWRDADEVIEALLDWADKSEDNKIPTSSDLNITLARERGHDDKVQLLKTGNYPTARVLRRFFGSVPAARKAAEAALRRRTRSRVK